MLRGKCVSTQIPCSSLAIVMRNHFHMNDLILLGLAITVPGDFQPFIPPEFEPPPMSGPTVSKYNQGACLSSWSLTLVAGRVWLRNSQVETKINAFVTATVSIECLLYLLPEHIFASLPGWKKGSSLANTKGLTYLSSRGNGRLGTPRNSLWGRPGKRFVCITAIRNDLKSAKALHAWELSIIFPSSSLLRIRCRSRTPVALYIGKP